MAPGTEQEQQQKTGEHIKEGACLPLEDITLYTVKDEKPQAMSGRDLFLKKNVVVIAIPGAFTPVCSSRHAPGYIEKEHELMGKGVDEILCIATNDPYVMSAWAKSFPDTKVRFLSDQDKSFAKATGLECELFASTRLKRFSMLVKDGVVTKLNVESENNNLGVSSADHMLSLLAQ